MLMLKKLVPHSLLHPMDTCILSQPARVHPPPLNAMSRGMRWSSERKEMSAIDAEMYRDHYDGSHWQKDFCEDPLIATNGGPDKNVGLEFCADGVSPFGKKSHSMWFGALSVMNLPPALRHSVHTMHLCFIVPGPHKPVSPFLCHRVQYQQKHSLQDHLLNAGDKDAPVCCC